MTEPTSPVPGCASHSGGTHFSPWEPRLLHSEVGPGSEASTRPPSTSGSSRLTRHVHSLSHCWPWASFQAVLSPAVRFPISKRGYTVREHGDCPEPPARHPYRQDSNLGSRASHPAARPLDLLLLDCQGALWTVGGGESTGGLLKRWASWILPNKSNHAPTTSPNPKPLGVGRPGLFPPSLTPAYPCTPARSALSTTASGMDL